MMGLVSLLLLGIVGSLGSEVIKYIRILIWKRKYYEKFKTFVNGNKTSINKFIAPEMLHTGDLEEEIKSILKNPWMLDIKHWENFDGKEYRFYESIETPIKEIFFNLFVIFFSTIILGLILLSLIVK